MIVYFSFLTLTVTVSAQDLITCYGSDDCDDFFSDEVFMNVEKEACCSNLEDPAGFSYRRGTGNCQRCRIGWSSTQGSIDGGQY
jgi:hypothetical protein